MERKRILVVDDSSTVRHALTALLEKEGYEILTAENGDDAITKSQLEGPHLILMDVIMPGSTNGFRATRSISKNEITKHIPIILLSSKDMETDRIWGIRQGAKDFVAKPFDPADLLKKISIYI